MEDISSSHFLAFSGCGLWFYVLGCYIVMRLHRIWLRNKTDIQWIEKKRSKLSTLEKFDKKMRKCRNIHMGIIVFSCTFFILDYLIHEFVMFPGECLTEHLQRTVLDALVLPGLLMPAWFVWTIVIIMNDDQIKRIIEIMGKTRSEQQSSLSEAGERNRTVM